MLANVQACEANYMQACQVCYVFGWCMILSPSCILTNHNSHAVNAKVCLHHFKRKYENTCYSLLLHLAPDSVMNKHAT